MSVSQAIAWFNALAAKRGNAPIHQLSPSDFGSSVSRVVRGESELRVVWDGRDEYLAVQISHGPSSGPQNWLELFGTMCKGGVIPDATQGEVTFASAVEYGLELTSPGA